MTEERKVEEDKKVKSKLRPNTEAFKPEAVIPNNQPYIPKEWENNVMLTNDQQSFNPMVYNMLAGFGNGNSFNFSKNIRIGCLSESKI